MTSRLDYVASRVLMVAMTVALAAVVAILMRPSTVQAASVQAESGPQLFVQHCGSCHQATGRGIEGAFPPLVANPAAADADYVESVIRDGLSGPLTVLGVNYDTAMPAVSALSDPVEIDAVVQYVIELSGRSVDQGSDDTPEEPAEPLVPDADLGHDLFIGADRFDNGGGACSSCHTAGSVGNLGGTSLGPDLTSVFGTLGGEAGLTGWLANPPSRTMQPIFADHPLTEAEVSHLVAFLDDAPSQERTESSVDTLVVAGIAGLVVLLAGMAVAWRGMRQTYLEHLASRRTTGWRSSP